MELPTQTNHTPFLIKGLRTFTPLIKGAELKKRLFGHGEARVYRGTGVSCGVRRTTWDRSLKNWELQIPCFEEFSGEGTLWDSSLPVSLTLRDTPALYTPRLPLRKDYETSGFGQSTPLIKGV